MSKSNLNVSYGRIMISFFRSLARSSCTKNWTVYQLCAIGPLLWKLNLYFTWITILIIKITISSIVIGLRNSYLPLIHLSSCYRTVFIGQLVIEQFVIGQLVIEQFVIGQLNQPITFNVVVYQPMTNLVSITIETAYKLLNSNFLQNGEVYFLEQRLYFGRQ